MIKAGALYLSIVIALVIALLCGAVISMAFFYRLQHQHDIKYNKLDQNLNTGIAIALRDDSLSTIIDLYNTGQDSISILKEKWGLFELTSVDAYCLKDTLREAFFSGIPQTDSIAIYLIDEDRPVSVSGNTFIKGMAYIPKAGIKKAYVDGKAYSREQAVYGKIKDSEHVLPGLDSLWLLYLDGLLRRKKKYPAVINNVRQSFHSETLTMQAPERLDNVSLRGKIIIIADTLVTIGKQANLQDILVFAPAIRVEDGFKGTCQLFAADSIIVGKNVIFNYPSALGLLKAIDNGDLQPRIVLGKNTTVGGIVFTYEQRRSELQTLLALHDGATINGEVYATGYLNLEKGSKIFGKALCNRFLLHASAGVYENFLVDVTIDRSKLSSYYLSANIFGAKNKERKVLQWLK